MRWRVDPLLRCAVAIALAGLVFSAGARGAGATPVTYEATGTYAFLPGSSPVVALSSTGSFRLRFTLDDAGASLGPCPNFMTYRCEYPGAVLSFGVRITSDAGSLSFGSDSFGASLVVFNDGEGFNTVDPQGGSPVAIPSLDGIPAWGFIPFGFQAGFNSPPGPLTGWGLAEAVASLADLSQWGGDFSAAVFWREPQTHQGPPWPREADLYATLTSIQTVPEPKLAALLAVGLLGLTRTTRRGGGRHAT